MLSRGLRNSLSGTIILVGSSSQVCSDTMCDNNKINSETFSESKPKMSRGLGEHGAVLLAERKSRSLVNIVVRKTKVKGKISSSSRPKLRVGPQLKSLNL